MLEMVKIMKIYVDVIFFLNFSFDLLLLVSVKLLLKRFIKWKRIILASLLGAFSTFLLFCPLNSFFLFLFKVIVSFLMIFVGFGKAGFWKNICYLYFVSILLGGFLWFINLQFSYKNEGLLFFYNGFSMPFIVLLILSPIILIWYFRQSRYFRFTLSNVHQVELIKGEKHYFYRAYYDTGNKLVDPYKKREVTLLYDPSLSSQFERFLVIPYRTLQGSGIVRGVVFDQMIIDGEQTFSSVLIGFSNQPFGLEDTQMILHAKFLS